METNGILTLDEIKKKIKEKLNIDESLLLVDDMVEYYKQGIQLGDTQSHFLLAKYYSNKSMDKCASKNEIVSSVELFLECIKRGYDATKCCSEIILLYQRESKILKRYTDAVFTLLDEFKGTSQSYYGLYFKDCRKYLSKLQKKSLADKLLEESNSKNCPRDIFSLLGFIYLGQADAEKLFEVDIVRGVEFLEKAVNLYDNAAFEMLFSIYVAGSELALNDLSKTISPNLNKVFSLLERIQLSPYDKYFLKNEIAGFGRYKYKTGDYKYLHKIFDLEISCKCISILNMLQPIVATNNLYDSLGIFVDSQSENDNFNELVLKIARLSFESYKNNCEFKFLTCSELFYELYSLQENEEIKEELATVKQEKKKRNKEKTDIYTTTDYCIFAEQSAWSLNAKCGKSKLFDNFLKSFNAFTAAYKKAFKRNDSFTDYKMQFSYILYYIFLNVNSKLKYLVKETYNKSLSALTDIIEFYDCKAKYLQDLFNKKEIDKEIAEIRSQTISKLKSNDLHSLYKILGNYVILQFGEMNDEVKSGFCQALDSIRI